MQSAITANFALTRSRAGIGPLVVQGLFVAIATLLALFLPPAQGAMRIVTLPGAPSPLTWLKPDMNWRLLRAGDHLVIVGERGRVLPVALRHGALAISALPLLCGSNRKLPSL